MELAEVGQALRHTAWTLLPAFWLRKVCGSDWAMLQLHEPFPQHCLQHSVKVSLSVFKLLLTDT